MKFSELPIGACFKTGKRVHRKSGERSYQPDGFMGEKPIKPSRSVSPALCNRVRPLVEFGKAKIK